MDLFSAALVFLVVAVAGVVTGLNGFGFAVVGAVVLATLLDPQTAVVVMILPMLATNLSLVRELSREGLRSCIVRFWPYVLLLVIGL